MHLDVVELKAFYYRTTLGRWVQAQMQRELRGLWPNVRDMRVEGFGFAAPFLRPFLADTSDVLSLMPAEQGVIPWPANDPNRSLLVEETEWPLESSSIDRLLVAHGLETCERPAALLEEMYRVSAPQGRVVLIVPNRLGSWARRDATPFGYGRPYSFGQLDKQLRIHGFDPVAHRGALYAPPHYSNRSLRLAGSVERMARGLNPQRFAGVLIVEAQKRLYPPPQRIKERKRSTLEVLGGLAAPVPTGPAGIRGFSPTGPDFGNSKRNG